MEGLHRDFEGVSLEQATAIFDAYVLDHRRPIEKKRQTSEGFEAEFIHQFWFESEVGWIFFKFTLNEMDPNDPLVLIVSCHTPSFKTHL